MSVLSKSVKVAFNKYPILRGMVSYGCIWPISSFIQQTVEGKRFNSENSYDWWRCIRFGIYGSCYVAPTLYSWLTLASLAWPATTLRAGLAKTFFETISYTPFAMCSFYFFMSLLECKTFKEAAAEVSTKFWPTYKVGASIWPAVALVNYTLIPPKNRVPFISICSLIWTCFLAYMKHLEKEEVSKLTRSSQLIKK
ncbi:mpv17-like protein isoform X2 [Aricia agestis]|uniref:mpv17-like protein isoform X2 n=1 Tax=Aricia agestis TaxID=91739 RepID=UPI001C20BA24|nr:mpv17-like protein isoform X2 [Aricia agestis]